jgi:hypothetical protein
MVAQITKARFSKCSLVLKDRGPRVRRGIGRIIGSHINPLGTMEVTCADLGINNYLKMSFDLQHMLLLVM